MPILSSTEENIQRVAQWLREGQLAVLPTETVYGLAANIEREDALREIFRMKARPQENPLIVHAANVNQIRSRVAVWNDRAEKLATRFWPGPISLVLPKLPQVSPIVTATGPTVAVRIPEHPVALAVLESEDLLVAMPSANPFMSVSPTRAALVHDSILRQVAAVLDGGECQVGIESTVVDLTSDVPQILRPGMIDHEMIESALQENVRNSTGTALKKSPGQYRRHYAPKTQAILVERVQQGVPGIVLSTPETVFHRRLALDPGEYARRIYAVLSELDQLGADRIEIEMPPQTADWAAIWDRLEKATAPLA